MAKMRNDAAMLESAQAGYRGDAETALWSSPLWLAWEAGAYMAQAHSTPITHCHMSRGFSVRVRTSQGNEYIVSFSGKYLTTIKAQIK